MGVTLVPTRDISRIQLLVYSSRPHPQFQNYKNAASIYTVTIESVYFEDSGSASRTQLFDKSPSTVLDVRASQFFSYVQSIRARENEWTYEREFQ